MNTSVQDPQEKNKATIILISNMATLEKNDKNLSSNVNSSRNKSFQSNHVNDRCGGKADYLLR